MNIQLADIEARVMGCLIEKEITTPDQYPLSLNALVNACNQKSNRDPLLNLEERTVQGTLDALTRRHLVLERSGFGSRVSKYQHRFCNTDFGSLKLAPIELAILCELLLRGPQTPGELRTRASRMATIESVEDVEQALNGLGSRDDGPYVVRLAREPGRRDSCWAQLFTGAPTARLAAATEDEIAAPAKTAAPAQAVFAKSTTTLGYGTDLAQLENRVDELEALVEKLTKRLEVLEAR